tara:strand:+ start:130 stop:663 length:534 start_codon:yes stop_codon:yes gene_type:complete
MIKKLKFISISIFFLISFYVLFKGLNNTNSYSPEQSLEIDTNIESKLLYSEEKVTLNQLIEQNNLSIINIWASWCLPCRKEHPYLEKLKNFSNINLIGINYKDNKSNAKKFLNELGNPYSNIMLDEKGTNSIELGAYGVPETILLDNKSKKIIKKYIGPLDDVRFKEISEILKNEKI